jgi:predicted RNase H-like HicB family nuclease
MNPEYPYRMIVSWSKDDHLWIVEIPELPGAMADGATPEEAIQQAQAVIREWIEVARQDGRPIPEPQPFPASTSA